MKSPNGRVARKKGDWYWFEGEQRSGETGFCIGGGGGRKMSPLAEVAGPRRGTRRIEDEKMRGSAGGDEERI